MRIGKSTVAFIHEECKKGRQLEGFTKFDAGRAKATYFSTLALWLLNSQKIYFKPNWISLGATDVWVMTPKVAVPKVVPGLANCG